MAATMLTPLSEVQHRVIRQQGESITYRDAEIEIELKALFGRSRFVAESADGAVRIQWSDRDFLVVADDLSFAGRRIEPARGATIRVALSGRAELYEVRPLGDEPCWRWSGPGRSVRRIHAKLLQEEGPQEEALDEEEEA